MVSIKRMVSITNQHELITQGNRSGHKKDCLYVISVLNLADHDSSVFGTVIDYDNGTSDSRTMADAIVIPDTFVDLLLFAAKLNLTAIGFGLARLCFSVIPMKRFSRSISIQFRKKCWTT